MNTSILNREIVGALKIALLNGTGQQFLLTRLQTDTQPGLPLNLADALEHMQTALAEIAEQPAVVETAAQIETDAVIESDAVGETAAQVETSGSQTKPEVRSVSSDPAGLIVTPETQLPLAMDIATKMIQMGCKVIAFPRPQKAIKEKDWQNRATNDLVKAKEWIDEIGPHCNIGVCGSLDSNWYFDDDGDILLEYEKQYGKIATYRCRSCSGGTHLYFKQNDLSRATGNIKGTRADGSETWSARVDRRYIVAAGSSAHKDNDPNLPEYFYTCLENIPVIEAPASFIEFLKSRAKTKNPTVAMSAPTPGMQKIQHGGINDFLASQTGRLRNAGLNLENLTSSLLQIAHDYCEPPINDEEVKAVARSISNYPAGDPTDKHGRLEISSPSVPELTAADIVEAPVPQSYPKFPEWVMYGTSLYENFVKPVCDTNSTRIPYFMWVPAMMILMNYIGPKIALTGFNNAQVPYKGSIYTVIIGEKGKTIKSSSVGDGMQYFQYCGMLQHSTRDTKQAEGKTIVFLPGSSEGMGAQMQKSNCKNALMWYDELSKLVQKASIESSSMISDLLTMYESGAYGNNVKSTKETFSLEPNTYCASLIACTTTQKFTELWSKMVGSDTGLNDRFFWVLQPEKLPEPSLQKPVNTLLGSIKTKQLVDKAVMQRQFRNEFEGDHHGLIDLVKIDNRFAQRAERWALGIAVDLGLDSITDDCIDRACAIVNYEIEVKRYLRTYEATTREAQIQGQIREILERRGGITTLRDLKHTAKAHRHGTSLWTQAYTGLIRDGAIRAEQTGNLVNVRLVEHLDFEE